MPKNIEPKLKSIGEYLKRENNEKFVIPPYQRAYSWEISHCDKLWQDVEDFIASSGQDPYFFGTIIVDCSDDNAFNLIDGQQRTTTFLLLLKALQLKISQALQNIAHDQDSEVLEKALSTHQDTLFGILYMANDASSLIALQRNWDEARKVQILENHSINEVYPGDLKNILDAETFEEAEQNTTKIERKRRDNKYTNFFKNFRFFYEKLSLLGSETQLNNFTTKLLKECQVIEIRSWNVAQAIAMFNSLNSTGLPLSNSDIISAQLFANTEESKRSFFSSEWKSLIKLADTLAKASIVNIDGVLQQNMYISRAVNKEYKENEVTTPGVRSYYTIIRKDLLSNPDTLCDRLQKILNIWDKIRVYPVVKVLNKFNANSSLFLISYLDRFEIEDINPDVVQPIVDCLLRLFAILEVVDSGYSSSKFKTYLYNENLKLVDRNYPMTNIQEDFNLHIMNNWNPAELEEDIENSSKNSLVYLNDYLYAKSKGASFDIEDNVNIEHVMPSSGRNIDSIRIDAGLSDQEEFELYANKLGNKILLEDNINKSIGNNWFRTKKGNSISNDKGQKGYKGSKYALAASLSNYSSDLWQKKDIDEATRKAAIRIRNFIVGEAISEENNEIA